MLVELGVVEQRAKAVYEVLDGASVTDVARRYGVARQTVHDWLRRYANDGCGQLADKNSKPASCPHQMSPLIEAKGVSLRRAYPSLGPLTIIYELECARLDPLPGRSSVYRALIRHGLISSRPANAAGGGRTTSAGSARALWSCGRWTSSVVST